jgi:PST family polysaccharide transporter
MDAETREDALLRGTALLSLIVCPMAVGLMAVAPTVTAVVFDPRWATMAPMLAILSALSVFRPMSWTIGSYLLARDKPRWVMLLAFVKVALLMGAIVALAPLGELWACAAVGFAFGLHALLNIWAVRRLDGISAVEMLGGLVRPLIACAPMVGAVYGARHLLALRSLNGTLIALIVEIAVGGLVFVPSALLFAPFTARNLLGLIRKIVFRANPDGDEDVTP